MAFRCPLKGREKGQANRAPSQESSKTSLTNFQDGSSTLPPSASSPPSAFHSLALYLSLFLSRPPSSTPLAPNILFFPRFFSFVLALPPSGSLSVPLSTGVLAAIKSQFYTGGYLKLITSTRGAQLEWTARNYFSTAVHGLYEPYKNGTTQPRRRSRTKPKGILRGGGDDSANGDLVEDK